MLERKTMILLKDLILFCLIGGLLAVFATAVRSETPESRAAALLVLSKPTAAPSKDCRCSGPQDCTCGSNCACLNCDTHTADRVLKLAKSDVGVRETITASAQPAVYYTPPATTTWTTYPTDVYYSYPSTYYAPPVYQSYPVTAAPRFFGGGGRRTMGFGGGGCAGGG